MIRNNSFSPIVVFLYNRYNHTKQTLQALVRNNEFDFFPLYIFVDGPKNEKDKQSIKKIKKLVVKLFKNKNNLTISYSTRNLGLAESIIRGVTMVLQNFNKVIVLEDDLVTHPLFLTYMNKALGFYQNRNNIFSISGYSHPQTLMDLSQCNLKNNYFFLPRPSSWGWGTWKNRWKNVDFDVKDYDDFKSNSTKQKEFNLGGDDLSNMLKEQMLGKLDSWAIRWAYSAYKNNQLTLYPIKSFINNIGMDGSGTHSGINKKYFNDLDHKVNNFNFPDVVKIDKCALNKFQKVYKKTYIEKIKFFIKKTL